jgi:hypothetical protein
MPVEFELYTGPREPLAAKAPNPRTTADSPHNLTPFVLITAMLISVVALGISWMSYQRSSDMFAAKAGLSKEAQSASLESEIRFDRNLTDFEQSSSNKKRIRLLFSWMLRNPGNTVATRVASQWIERLNSTNNSPLRPTDEHNFLVHDIDKHQEKNRPLVIDMTPEEFTTFRQGRAQLEITGKVKYKDTFGRDHALNWTAILKGDGLLVVRQF